MYLNKCHLRFSTEIIHFLTLPHALISGLRHHSPPYHLTRQAHHLTPSSYLTPPTPHPSKCPHPLRTRSPPPQPLPSPCFLPAYCSRYCSRALGDGDATLSFPHSSIHTHPHTLISTLSFHTLIPHTFTQLMCALIEACLRPGVWVGGSGGVAYVSELYVHPTSVHHIAIESTYVHACI